MAAQPNTNAFQSLGSKQASSVPFSKGGFSLDILSGQADPKYLCSICHLILRNPIQSFCGHRFCRACIEDFVREKSRALCPSCEEENAENEYSFLQLDQTFPDNAIKREFNSLVVRCPNAGCDWTGAFKAFEQHEADCKHRVIPTLPESTQVVDPELIKCTLATEIEPVKVRLDQVERLVKTTQDEIATSKAGLAELQNQVQEVGTRVQVQVQAQMHGGDQRDAVMAPAGTASNEVRQQVAKLQQQAMTYEQITGVLNQQMEKCLRVLEVMMRQAHQRERAITEQKEQIKSLETKVRAVERTLLVKDAALADMNMRLQYLELTSYDGTLLWKISDVKKRQQDAITGKITSFYSPCFYTSRQGYKMCARMYLNGDGMGKNTHISLFFVIMRGTYDALLPWPFRQKVTFMLLDQNRREHIIDAFRPDPSSSSFKRPTSEMNIASGCPLFMPINQLEADGHAYVKEDIMFVRIMVDTHDLN